MSQLNITNGSQFNLERAEPTMICPVQDRLSKLGLTLPEATDPVAAYVAHRRVGSVVYMSGQGSLLKSGEGVFGKVGRDVSIEDGVRAARMTGLNLIAQARAICDGDLSRIVQWARMTGYVNCVDGFTEIPAVIDGASKLLEDVFGEAGLAARAAVGVNALPMNITVEIQAEIEIAA